jgi:thiol:disulfide interchange protein DsbD
MYRLFIFFLLLSNLFSQSVFPNNKVQLIDSKTTNMYNLTSEVTFISFWATWCLPCLKEIDKLNEFIDDFENVSVILINEDRPGDKAKVKSFIRSRKYPVDENYHIIFDFDKKLSRYFNAQPIPLTLILKDNKILYRKRGFYVGDEVEIKKQLWEALND